MRVASLLGAAVVSITATVEHRRKLSSTPFRYQPWRFLDQQHMAVARQVGQQRNHAVDPLHGVSQRGSHRVGSPGPGSRFSTEKTLLP